MEKLPLFSLSCSSTAAIHWPTLVDEDRGCCSRWFAMTMDASVGRGSSSSRGPSASARRPTAPAGTSRTHATQSVRSKDRTAWRSCATMRCLNFCQDRFDQLRCGPVAPHGRDSWRDRPSSTVTEWPRAARMGIPLAEIPLLVAGDDDMKQVLTTIDLRPRPQRVGVTPRQRCATVITRSGVVMNFAQASSNCARLHIRDRECCLPTSTASGLSIRGFKRSPEGDASRLMSPPRCGAFAHFRRIKKQQRVPTGRDPQRDRAA